MFPLLKQIDEQIEYDSIEWNRNAFQTLLTSNLDRSTIRFYAIEVAFRYLECSLDDHFWNETSEALNSLASFLFDNNKDDTDENYIHEAICQLLMFSSIAFVKLQKIRRIPMKEIRLASTTMSILLLRQDQFNSKSMNKNYSLCIESMKKRHCQRLFLAGQWLRTISNGEFDLIQRNFESYMNYMLEQLFSARSIREKIQNYIEKNLFLNDDDRASSKDAISNGFVFIQRFPKFDQSIVEKNANQMRSGFMLFLEQYNEKPLKLLKFSLWSISCMIESDEISLDPLRIVLSKQVHETDAAQNSLKDQDLLVFLILCAQQNRKDILSVPYSLFSMNRFCDEIQTNWWLSALKRTEIKDFDNQLKIIQLDKDEIDQFPPKSILLRTAQLLLLATAKDFQYCPRSFSDDNVQYAMKYFDQAKICSDTQKEANVKGKQLFNFSSLKSSDENCETLFERCVELLHHYDELKVCCSSETSSISQESSRSTSPVVENLPETITPDVVVEDKILLNDSLPIPEKENSSHSQIDDTEDINEENNESPFFDMIYNHMNGVNQWIADFYNSNTRIQADMNTIRDRLQRLNRTTNNMIANNIGFLQFNLDENN